ncbi:MAG: uroporphyrinogen decarboxylase family protein [Atribacterota bacterium]|nr:uroporphyrinogen decarboxylase family protein [Atribacterota bacterium]MDD5636556.1 uroporphyrinogen decarboxylase family protein [Atribacterota bacterium]
MSIYHHKLTPKQRLNKVLNSEIPDRVPWVDHFMNNDLPNQILKKQLKYNFKFIRNSPEILDFLGMDAFEFRVTAPVYCEILKENGIEMYGSGLIKSKEDLKEIKLPDPGSTDILKEAEILANNFGDRYALILSTRSGFMNTYLSLGFDGFSYALIDDPGFIDNLFYKMRDWTLELVEHLKQFPFDAIRVTDDIAYKNGLLFSPNILEKYLLSAHKIVKEFSGLPFMFHSDGNFMAIMDRLIDIGVDVVSNIEPEAMDIVELKKKYGDKVIIMGNISVNTLATGTPEEVFQETKQRLQQLAPGSGYILSSSNSLPVYCKPENIVAMKSALEDYGWY